MKINAIRSFNIFHTTPLKTRNFVFQNSCDTFEKSVAFKGFECSTDNFYFKKVKGMHCACCGRKLLQQGEIDALVNDIPNIQDKKGKELIRALTPFQKLNLHDTEHEVLENVIEMASLRKYQNLNLQGLIGKLWDNNKKVLQEEQKGVFTSIRQECDNLPKKVSDNIKAILREAEDLIDGDTEKYFKRNTLIKKIKSAIKDSDIAESPEYINTKYKETVDKIQELATSLPTTHDNVNAFYAKYRRESPKDILKRLLRPLLTTTEHVHPESKGGANNTGNYILMCGDCNSRRSNMPYTDWIKTHPKMQESFELYMEDVIRELEFSDTDTEKRNKGKTADSKGRNRGKKTKEREAQTLKNLKKKYQKPLDDPNYYPEEICEAVCRESGGMINVKPGQIRAKIRKKH